MGVTRSCRQAILEFLPLSNIVKISDEELEFITGIKDEQEALKSLFVWKCRSCYLYKRDKWIRLHHKRTKSDCSNRLQ